MKVFNRKKAWIVLIFWERRKRSEWRRDFVLRLSLEKDQDDQCWLPSFTRIMNRGVLLSYTYIVGCRGASQLGGSLLGIPPGYFPMVVHTASYTLCSKFWKIACMIADPFFDILTHAPVFWPHTQHKSQKPNFKWKIWIFFDANYYPYFNMVWPWIIGKFWIFCE